MITMLMLMLMLWSPSVRARPSHVENEWVLNRYWLQTTLQKEHAIYWSPHESPFRIGRRPRVRPASFLRQIAERGGSMRTIRTFTGYASAWPRLK